MIDDQILLGSKNIKASDIKQISIAKNVGVIHRDRNSVLYIDFFEIVCHDQTLIADENLEEVTITQLEQFAKRNPEIQLIENAKVSIRPV